MSAWLAGTRRFAAGSSTENGELAARAVDVVVKGMVPGGTEAARRSIKSAFLPHTFKPYSRHGARSYFTGDSTVYGFSLYARVGAEQVNDNRYSC